MMAGNSASGAQKGVQESAASQSGAPKGMAINDASRMVAKPTSVQMYTPPVEPSILPTWAQVWWKRAVIGVPILGLLFVTYMFFAGVNPRAGQRTVEETLAAYTMLIQQYGAVAGPPLNSKDAKEFLIYFDSVSVNYFHDNVRELARLRNPNDAKALVDLGDSRIEGEALLAVVGRPPLSGISRVLTQRPFGNGEVEVTVLDIAGGQHRMRLGKSGGSWAIADFGGLRQTLEREIGGLPPEQKATK